LDGIAKAVFGERNVKPSPHEPPLKTLGRAAPGAGSLPLRASAGLAITTDGQPTATIVLAESIRPNDLAVAALVSNVKQISGATLPVIAEKEFAAAKNRGWAHHPTGRRPGDADLYPAG